MEAIYSRLALSAILWWSGEKDEAIAELASVVAVSRPESDLRLELAGLLVQQGRPADAIDALDAVQPLDNLSLKRREELAINAAIATGNAERARHAAERLFGLRLDTETQIRLSGQMRQLGLHELADALLGRARRRAGGGSSDLVTLMTQYQRQGKLDQAAQIALQILRLSSGSLAAVSRAALDPEQARPAALRVLAASGGLPKLIERTREQLKHTPNSVAIHQMLADYYTAARQSDRAEVEMRRILELKPDDDDLRLRLAINVASGGDTTKALEQYRAVFLKNPDLGANSFSQMFQLLERAGGTAPLVDVLNDLDDKSFARLTYVQITRLLSSAPADRKTSLQAQKLFRRAWTAFPDSRLYLLRRTFRNDLWISPDAFDYACEAVLPESATTLGVGEYAPFAWQVSAAAANVPQNYENLPLVRRLLDVAEERNALDRVLARIDEAQNKLPGWKTAGALRVLVLCRAGRHEHSRAIFSEAMSAIQHDASAVGPGSKLLLYWTVGLELERYAATRDLAFAAYEACLSDSDAWLLLRSRNVPAELPIRNMVPLALQTGRRDQARRALLGFAGARWPDVSYTDEIVTVMRMIGFDMIGASLLELGFAADALPLLRDAQNLAARTDLTLSPTSFPNLPELPRLIEEHLKSAAEQMSESELAAIAVRSIAEAAEKGLPSKPGIAPAGSTGDRGAQSIDLMTTVTPRSLETASVHSMVADSLGACSATELAGLVQPLESLRQAHPEDLSVAICLALRAQATHDAGRIHAALEQLDVLVEKTPLEPLAAGVRANARERAVAARQIPLWLVARECRRQASPSYVLAIGDRLATRALEAAGRQDDRVWLLAMLREQGELALDRNDKNGAAAAWSRMLELVITPPEARARRPAGGNGARGAMPAKAGAAVPEGR